MVGPQGQAIAECLSAKLSDHRFKAESDVMSLGKSGGERRIESFEQICFLDSFAEHSKLQRQQVLSSGRDRLAGRVLHLESETKTRDPWQLTDSLSLGYRRIASGQHKQTAWQLYEFNIISYKSTPDWLNPKHWSNPQNWDRYRW